ncbi:hypothetical protein BpHYR1_047531 [Brachionus plicatilis]|uniref:Uncharacterized protein n=1 Tax=Brachionus plicatilis TaxID=10195 RepID=A0A3M7QUC1_BRAPC|nr:hypothetical protein BpHYR1_047531 [Brachionus plicatilis]
MIATQQSAAKVTYGTQSARLRLVRFVHESKVCAHHCGKVGQNFVHASFESAKFKQVHQQCRLATIQFVNSDTSHTNIDFAHVLAIHGFQLIQACNKIEQNEK